MKQTIEIQKVHKLSSGPELNKYLYLADIRDNTGVRFVYTPNLRKHDATILTLGYINTENDLVIPPHLDNFELQAQCGANCLQAVSTVPCKLNKSNQFCGSPFNE